MAVEKDRWYDHVAKEGGDVISMVCKGMNVNFIEASTWLGDHYHLTPKTKTREQHKVVAEYIYKDKDDIPLHKKIRYQPKSFSQQHWTPDGWKPGLMKDVDPVLYQLPDIMQGMPQSDIPGRGGKDADNRSNLTCATTQTMALKVAGQLHRNTWAPTSIIADKDEPGRAHAAMVAKALSGKLSCQGD